MSGDRDPIGRDTGIADPPSGRRDERRLMLLAGAYFFLLLASYYLLRPVRDEMAVRFGVDQLHWLFTATFLAMLAAVPLFGTASARLRRGRLIPGVYLLFAICLLLFHALLTGEAAALAGPVFYVFVSVYNLFVVSVFWSFMADICDRDQGKRLFGRIAAGGSLGAIAGPALAAALAQRLGPEPLLPVAAGLLAGATVLSVLLARGAGEHAGSGAALGGGRWDGLVDTLRNPFLRQIGAFVGLFATIATFLYFQQAQIVSASVPSSAERTALFAAIDLAVNLVTVICQLFVAGALMRRIGLGRTLAAVPALLVIGLLLLAALPQLAVLIAVQIVHRSGTYAITRPAREVLFTTVERGARYKAKNFIDTLVFRAGDATASWIYAGLKGLGLGLPAIALVAVPLAALWAMLGLRLGRAAEQRGNPPSHSANQPDRPNAPGDPP